MSSSDDSSNDVLAFIVAYESDEASEDEIVAGFQMLINSGVVWQLQGSYGRLARQLVEAGVCVLPEKPKSAPASVVRDAPMFEECDD